MGRGVPRACPTRRGVSTAGRTVRAAGEWYSAYAAATCRGPLSSAAGVVNEASIPLVRRVGPTAWAVLELMRHRSRTDERAAIALVTIRTVASELGLSKNAVHRAIRRLRDAGLIEPHQTRSSGGTFTAGHYALVATSVVLPTTGTTIPLADVEQLIPAEPTAATFAPSGQLTLDV